MVPHHGTMAIHARRNEVGQECPTYNAGFDRALVPRSLGMACLWNR